MSFAKNMSNKYSQKLLDSAEKSTTDVIETVSKRAIQKTSEATGVSIRNKVADKITSVSKKSPKELHSQNENEIEIPKERYLSPEKRPKNIDEIRLLV